MCSGNCRCGWLERALYETMQHLESQRLRITGWYHGGSKVTLEVYGQTEAWPMVELAFQNHASTDKQRLSLSEAKLRRSSAQPLEHLDVTDCSICLGPLQAVPPERQVALCVAPSRHIFHKECISPALSVQHRCPYCRQGLTPEQLHTFFPQTPRAGAVAALRLQPPKIRRRIGNAANSLWTQSEEEALERPLAAHGTKWIAIVREFNFRGKTPMQLKDEMRNLNLQRYE